MSGHAIEARIYAEDPAAGFLPATGTLVDWRPSTDPAVRWDSGVEAGSEVGVEFDPMLAKVTAHAPTRTEAALRLALALERSRIRGVTTNRDFLVTVLRSPAFLSGDTSTDFIGRAVTAAPRQPSDAERAVAAVGAALALERRSRAGAGVLRSLPRGWRNSFMPPEELDLADRWGELPVRYRAGRDGRYSFTVGDRDLDVRPGPGEGGWVWFEADGRAHRFDVTVDGSRVWAQGPSGDHEFTVAGRFPDRGHETVAGGLLAPMPGKVIAVAVSEGATVEAGQLLVVVEAMKMEHRVLAPAAGTVASLRAGPGDQVSAGDLLVVLEPATAAP